MAPPVCPAILLTETGQTTLVFRLCLHLPSWLNLTPWPFFAQSDVSVGISSCIYAVPPLRNVSGCQENCSQSEHLSSREPDLTGPPNCRTENLRPTGRHHSPNLVL